jgi:hypothetical protein
VRSCRRRGAAIDLILDRGRNNRSQIVFTKPNPGRAGGRAMIFWQTARTAQRARPGQRVPTRRASKLGQLTITIDTRERYPYKFSGRPVEPQRAALPVGDYAIHHDKRLIAAVERKTPEDFAKSLIDGSLNYALAELATPQRGSSATRSSPSTTIASRPPAAGRSTARSACACRSM